MAQKPAEREQLEITDVAELRAWLEVNADSSPGVWLVTGKKAAGARYVAYEDLVREALCFGWIDGQARPLDELRSQQLLTPRRPGSGWSRPNKLRIAELEAAGRMTPRGRAVVEAAKASGTWTALDLVEDLVEPPDLVAALDAEPEARKHWDAYPRSVKRAALEQVYGAKRPETRAKRIANAVALAAQNQRPGQWQPKPPA